MTFQFFQIPSETRNEPVLNNQASSIVRTEGTSSILGFENYYRQFWQQFKESPELLSVINILATDVIGQRPEFFDADGNPLGKTNLKKSQKIWRDMSLKAKIKEWLIDGFVTGDGYLWKGKPTKRQIRKAVKEVLDLYDNKLSVKEYNKLALSMLNYKELTQTRDVRVVASSTMQIITSDYDILKYHQSTKGHETDFNVDEIIHYKYMSINGESNGWSPLKTLFREIALLYFVKGNMEAYMRNGGSPDKLFVLENERPGSSGYNKFVEGMKSFNPMLNRHGKFIGTGKINVIDLNTASVDLEYKELALYCTSVLAFGYGIPVSRIPFLIGQSATSGDSGGLGESGYWNHVEEIQDQIEDLLNGKLLNEFSFSIQLSRKYRQDKVRDSQINSVNADTITKLQEIYAKQGKQIKTEKINALLLNPCSIAITSEDLEELPEQEYSNNMQGSVMNGKMNRNMLPNKDIMNEQDHNKRANTKRDTVNKDETRIASV